MKRPIILLDVDGVLADFTGAVLKIANGITGKSFAFDDVKEWDVFGLYPKDIKPLIVHEICQERFCWNLDVLPGSYAAVSDLKEIGEVYAVTAPWWSSKFWAHERSVWLRDHFDIPSSHVIHANAKHLIHGDVMIDDKPENLLEWRYERARLGWTVRAILVDAPYNRGPLDDGLHRARSWMHVVGLTRDWAER